MIQVSRSEFEQMVDKAISALPKDSREHLKNVAFIVEDDLSMEKRRQLNLANNQMLLGLYEGVPLSARQGTTKLLPDKITLYQRPIELLSHDLKDLYGRISNTIWHEVAHYYGLDHKRIRELDKPQ